MTAIFTFNLILGLFQTHACFFLTLKPSFGIPERTPLQISMKHLCKFLSKKRNKKLNETIFNKSRIIIAIILDFFY